MSAENIFRVTDDEKKAIRKLCTQTDDGINEDIKHLKEWIAKQPHLPQDTDDEWLKMMLYYNKFSVEKTKKKVDMYYSIKHLVPQYFEDRELSNSGMNQLCKEVMGVPLPNLHNLVRPIFLKFLGDGSKFNITDFIKSIFVVNDLRLAYDHSVGDTNIIDLQGVTLTHVSKITPVQVKHAYDILQKAYSDRIGYIDLINVSSVGLTFINIVSSVLPAKFTAKIRTHKSTSDLLKFYSPEILPNELGGTAGALDELNEEWLKFIRSQNDWLKETGLKRSDESKRIGEPLDTDMFGMCGTFKKLNVD